MNPCRALQFCYLSEGKRVCLSPGQWRRGGNLFWGFGVIASYFGGGNNNFPHIFLVDGLPYTTAKQKCWILNYFRPAQHLRFLFPLAQVTSWIRFVFPLSREIEVISRNRNRTPHPDVSLLIVGGSDFAPPEVYLDIETFELIFEMYPSPPATFKLELLLPRTIFVSVLGKVPLVF